MHDSHRRPCDSCQTCKIIPPYQRLLARANPHTEDNGQRLVICSQAAVSVTRLKRTSHAASSSRSSSMYARLRPNFSAFASYQLCFAFHFLIRLCATSTFAVQRAALPGSEVVVHTFSPPNSLNFIVFCLNSDGAIFRRLFQPYLF